jgi:aquaporin Z
LGVAIAWTLAGASLAHGKVNFAVTRPGAAGPWVAFAAETLISFLMMATILSASNSRRFSRGTPYLAAALVALFITFEAPLSGMSMNAARSFGSAFAAQEFTAFWVYLSAPFLGMTLAGLLYRRRVYCAKLHHHNNKRCPFHCNYGDLYAEQQ